MVVDLLLLIISTPLACTEKEDILVILFCAFALLYHVEEKQSRFVNGIGGSLSFPDKT